MKIGELMSKNVIHIGADEPVSVAARTLARHNIGLLPVCGRDGRLCGVVTDRDLVTRCLAAGRAPERTSVRQIMTAQVYTVPPDMDAGVAASLMGKHQVRRLPVVEQGRLCGVLSLGDLASQEDTSYDAVDALSMISENVSMR